MDYFLELYGSLERAGPGSWDCTRRAYALMRELPEAPYILDIGCGPGAQTVDLLRLSVGKVLALDFLPLMVDRTRAHAERAGVAERLEVVQQDMRELTFEPASFDVVWSEAALYNLGFENGLRQVWELVRPGGYVVVSEVVWLTEDPPTELVEYWRQYPEIDTVSNKRSVISQLGYHLEGDFVLPEEAWVENYYRPLERLAADKSEEWAGIPRAQAVLDEVRKEVALYYRHREHFGYAFFVMRRPCSY